MKVTIDSWSNGDGLVIMVDNDKVKTLSTPNNGVSRVKYIDLTPATHGVSSNRSIRVFQKGTDIEFLPGSCRDADGNLYDAIRFGTQVWMAQNLKTTTFRNGDSIPLTGDQTVPVRWYPGNNSANVSDEGYLYNYYAAVDARGIAPAGWHVPSLTEFNTLASFLSNNSAFHSGPGVSNTYTAKCLASDTGWVTSSTAYHVGNDQGYNNCTGFCAYPTGVKTSNYSTPSYHGQQSLWWTSTLYGGGNTNANCFWLVYNQATFTSTNYNIQSSMSIRCIKD